MGGARTGDRVGSDGRGDGTTDETTAASPSRSTPPAGDPAWTSASTALLHSRGEPSPPSAGTPERGARGGPSPPSGGTLDRCDVCGEVVELDEDGLPAGGRALYLWARGGEIQREEPPLCAGCSTALGVTAIAEWESDDEE